MYYGMYMSQFDIRRLTSLSGTQNQETDQLLLDTDSDIAAANLFHLNYERWMDTDVEVKDTMAFSNWMQSHTSLQHPVIIGIFENNSLVETSQPEYDHIVSVSKVDVTGNTITFCDNGIVYNNIDTPETTFNTSTNPNIFTYPFSTFIRTRQDALQSVSEYSLPNVYPTYINSGIAITGVKSNEESLVRIQLTSNDSEDTEIEDMSNIRPTSNDINLTIHLYNLQANTTYNLYQYKNPYLVPIQDFNWTYQKHRLIGSIILTKITTTDNPLSDTQLTKVISSRDIAIFRCVPEDAS
jgi:hypothetical protein